MTLLTSRHTVTALLVLALALRIAALELNRSARRSFADMDNYRQIADHIVAGEWARRTSCPPSASR
jgi:hypothetical protein